MLLPAKYFKVYAEKLSVTSGPKEAWDETEREFNRRYSATEEGVVLRRFKNYDSFQAAYRKYRTTGMLPGHIEIHILLVPVKTERESGK